jgi:hypothetical protein
LAVNCREMEGQLGRGGEVCDDGRRRIFREEQGRVGSSSSLGDTDLEVEEGLFEAGHAGRRRRGVLAM